MPPEVLEQISQNKNFDLKLPNKVNSWSLGVILLEIIQGHPMKIRQTCRIHPIDGNERVGVSAFSSANNDPLEIL